MTTQSMHYEAKHIKDARFDSEEFRRMKTIKGPAIFLAQFAGDKAPFHNLESIAHWAAGLGYKGVQIPSWDGRLFDLKRAAESKAYCDEVAGTLSRHGLHLTECRHTC